MTFSVYEVDYEVVRRARLSRSWLFTLKAMEERKLCSQGSGNWRFDANDSKDAPFDNSSHDALRTVSNLCFNSNLEHYKECHA